MDIIKLIGAIVTLIGSVFLLLGSLGLVRMPDVYNRIQTGTKASTLGTILVLMGIAVLRFEWDGKLVILIIFVLITNPVSSHILARSAHRNKVKMTDKTAVDALSEEEKLTSKNKV